MDFLIVFYIIIAILFFGILVFVYVNRMAKVEEHENLFYVLMFVASMIWPAVVLSIFINRLKGVKK